MKIREIRISRGMTQSELAKKIGISRSTVAMWETGSHSPSTEKLPIVAGVLSCSIDALFDKKKTPT